MIIAAFVLMYDAYSEISPTIKNVGESVGKVFVDIVPQLRLREIIAVGIDLCLLTKRCR